MKKRRASKRPKRRATRRWTRNWTATGRRRRRVATDRSAPPDYFSISPPQMGQTPTQVLILTEMVHDARVVRMNASHVPPTIRKWLGDSIGWWEGDTLVVETTNFTDKTRFRGATPDLKVT